MTRSGRQAGGTARSSVWLEGRARGRRGGGQPSGLDRDRITGATVRLLDAGGLDGFSMRRLARELDVTAMSVYWYVDAKDDLLELALDAVCGEVRLPGPGAADEDWREQLRRLATEYRRVLARHPWMSPLIGRFLNIGPHNLAFSRAVRHVVCRTGLPADRITSAIAAVLQFVYGYGTREGCFHTHGAALGTTRDAYVRHAPAEVSEPPAAAEAVQESRKTTEARGGDTVAELMERDFGYALDLLIAGIEVMAGRG
ncbi:MULTISPECIES: TetR/AcrR family transcriptional regulator [unclassified Streptomyces]|uniref:TetR/AcrR family transcriptional regulator n=1 Tax=unclassified Streptomyces TaxID=2593676 RepID=UPI001F04482B|nr:MULTISPECIES: TetR/AcrR family transcriptional regulator [unclassified Streptomyces]MCH0566998.1 TetR/AcrR family transcriptional regulator [Streptomyces sp. MUM 2J]MCH0572596.1 TetR/AcrR family transcriptional regulator [Streptomyces sp. MUM 136J]